MNCLFYGDKSPAESQVNKARSLDYLGTEARMAWRREDGSSAPPAKMPRHIIQFKPCFCFLVGKWRPLFYAAPTYTRKIKNQGPGSESALCLSSVSVDFWLPVCLKNCLAKGKAGGVWGGQIFAADKSQLGLQAHPPFHTRWVREPIKRQYHETLIGRKCLSRLTAIQTADYGLESIEWM